MPKKNEMYNSGIYTNMESAIAAAKQSQKILHAMSLSKREMIISKIREKTLENAETLAQMAVEETGMGNIADKIAKHQLVAKKTPGTENITTTAWSGDDGLTLVEMGPFGVIGAITPSTNPSETIICNTIGMIAGGNTVVFNPHPGALNTSLFAVKMINKAAFDVCGINDIACTVQNPSVETGSAMMKHEDIQLLVATGGQGLVNAVLRSGKRGLGAGAGNPPVLVDETADLHKAAKDIIDGCTFDNNLPCIAEKSIVALNEIASKLIHLMVNEQNCYHASHAEIEKLKKLVFTPKGLNRDCVGKSAPVLLRKIGVDSGARCIIFEGEKEHPLITEELMMPILGMVRVDNFDKGVETALWLEHGYRHSAHIHSKNIDRITAYARALDTAIIVKNAPSYAALGFGGEGFCSFTIASKTGEGLTSAATFTKSRRCVMSESLSIR